MGKNAQISIPLRISATTPTRSNTCNLVETLTNALYYVFVESQSSDVMYIKSTDNGVSWSVPIIVSSAITCTYLSIWYDRWSNISGGLIHCAYIDDANDILLYRNINTESSDSLSTEYTIWDFTSQAAGGSLSITRTRGGNLICGICVDAGAELFTKKSTDVGVNWTDIAALGEGVSDQIILLPGWAVDNQDVMAFFWDSDSGSHEISRKLYDDSANSWSESSIATSMVDNTSTYPHFAASVDITNSQNLLVAWSNVDTNNADLRCWKVTESAITEMTNVVLNSVDDQGMCAIGIDTITNYWYVFYGGKSDGSETWNTAVNIYYKVSQDGGTTWNIETALTTNVFSLAGLYCCPRFKLKYELLVIKNESYSSPSFNDVFILVENNMQHSNFQLGL
jgi:hypothetical protein